MFTAVRFFFAGVLTFVATASIAASARAQFDRHHGHHHGHDHKGHGHHGHDYGHYGGGSFIVSDSFYGTGGFAAGVVTPYPLGWGGLPYSSPYGGYYGGGWYGGYGGYGYGGGPWVGGFALPPVVVPAETMFGPGAVRRFMGVDPPLGTPIINQTTIVAPAAQQAAGNNNLGFGVNAPGANVPPALRVATTNPQTQQRARKLVDSGDTAFQQQRYAEAFTNYKDAARTAPDLAETHFRQAAASVALGRYDEAVTAIKLGLRLQPAWVDTRFRFAALYGPALLTRQQHLDALAQAANNRPSSDLLFLYGVTLFFDDAPRRAEPLFTRSEALAIGETWHIELFSNALARLPPDAGPQPVDAAKPILPAGPPAAQPIGGGGRDI